MSPEEENEGDLVEPPENGRAVTCYRCTHVNAPGRGTCRKCGAHLFIRCKDCGARNPRIQPLCLECGRRMHRSALSKFRAAFKRPGAGPGIRKRIIWAVVAAVLVAAGYVIVIELANFKFPSPR